MNMVKIKRFKKFSYILIFALTFSCFAGAAPAYAATATGVASDLGEPAAGVVSDLGEPAAGVVSDLGEPAAGVVSDLGEPAVKEQTLFEANLEGGDAASVGTQWAELTTSQPDKKLLLQEGSPWAVRDNTLYYESEAYPGPPVNWLQTTQEFPVDNTRVEFELRGHVDGNTCYNGPFIGWQMDVKEMAKSGRWVPPAVEEMALQSAGAQMDALNQEITDHVASLIDANPIIPVDRKAAIKSEISAGVQTQIELNRGYLESQIREASQTQSRTVNRLMMEFVKKELKIALAPPPKAPAKKVIKKPIKVPAKKK